jgi:hypothetical protein
MPSRESSNADRGEEKTPPDVAATVYAALHAIARRHMQAERPGHTLSATVLVHEAFLKLRAPDPGPSLLPYYQAAALAMRRILIDHARKRATDKRGAGRWQALELESVVDLAMNADPS